MEQVGARLSRVLTTDSVEIREQEQAVQRLKEAIEAGSKKAVIEKVAYLWFNRLCAFRFMDAHDYTVTGIVSPTPGHSQPEILAEAKQGYIDAAIEPYVDRQRVMDLLAGRIPSRNAQGEAYRLLLVGACNYYHELLPFLFERIDDYSELLLPEDLLSEHSIGQQVVAAMPDEACQDIEIIGWLYQFYISEKKDQVIGKVVASEDIPAATQLFTPNWIVKYMVQNSLGAQWLATYPDSKLKGQMEYYIEPAEQTDEVNAQLTAITPSQLDPEGLTLIDPASGSGHILVEAYELFKAIYLERGYRQSDVPQLILEKNLFGLDIDERAAQLTGFALMMKGRADDRRLFERGVKLNVMALVDSAGFDAEVLAKGVELSDYDLRPGDLTELKRLFEHATTFGSLIQVPEGLTSSLPALKKLREATSQDLFVADALKRLGPLVQQAELLAAQYEAVVANPPYMGGKYQSPTLKKFLKDYYEGCEKDFFSAFIFRNLAFSKPSGSLGVVAPYVWMFISSYEQLRKMLLATTSLSSLIQLEYNGFEPAMVPVAAFTLLRHKIPSFTGSYIRLSDFKGHQNQAPKTLEAINNPACGWLYRTKSDEFKKIPGSPLAYWISTKAIAAFENAAIDSLLDVRAGLTTGNTERFLRYWQEVPRRQIVKSLGDSESYIAYDKGGEFRKWFGNRDYVLAYSTQSLQGMREFPGHRSDGLGHFFRESITWAKITSGRFSCRYSFEDSGFDATATSAFGASGHLRQVAAVLNSKVGNLLLNMINSTMVYLPRDIKNFPLPPNSTSATKYADELIAIAQTDWDAYERSWDFQSLPLLTASSEPTPTLESSYTAWITQNRDTIAEMKRLEEENNRLFIDAYGLADELTPDVPIEQITLTVNPAYRYGQKESAQLKVKVDDLGISLALWHRFRQDTMKEFVSYAVGCMFGRYSLDKPGLILANQGETLDDYLQQVSDPSFMPDDDNVIPFLDEGWFEDDIVERFHQFLRVTFGEQKFAENLRFLEQAIGKDIRKYFLKDFYKDHVQTYKKRPIYWMFSSPKGSFSVLIYMHRYRPDTLSVILNDYLREYRSKLQARQKHLEGVSISPSVSAAEKTRTLKELEKLKLVLCEIDDYEREVIYPLATHQVEIDLDDGVKVNYNKFPGALAKVAGLSQK